MNDQLENRLTSLLDTEAGLLPSPSGDVGSVVARGRQRRNRARLVGAGSLLAVVVAAAGLGGGALAALRSEPTQTVAVDGAQQLSDQQSGDQQFGDQSGDQDASPSTTLVDAPEATTQSGRAASGVSDGRPTDSSVPQLPIMTIEPFPDEPNDPTSTTAPATTTSASTTAPSTTSTMDRPVDPPEGRRSTDDVIGALADNEILFFSNGEGCRGIEGGQAHPDWIEGQPGNGRNGDGTPTHGFAYNTGDSRRGEISWGFEPQSFALSGDCVLQMGIDDAYDQKRAVRIFRRYDRDGQDLPSDGYYSVWFYFPQDVSYDGQAQIDGETAFGFWNVFQIKNKIRGPDGSNETLSALSFNAGKVTGDDQMSFHLWSKAECGRVEECDAAGTIEQIATPRPIPVGEWVHLEMRLASRSDRNGRIEVWQDGVKIFDFTGVTERGGSDRVNWSVNSYGRLHRPAGHNLYADDALISTRPIHPLLFD